MEYDPCSRQNTVRDRADFREDRGGLPLQEILPLLLPCFFFNMKTSTAFYVTGLMSLILLIHSSSSQTIFNVREKQDILIEGNERFNFFDLELLKSLASSMRGNLLLSPVSVKAALAMILEGAGGKSAKELKEALRLTDDVKATRTQFRNFLNSLQANTPGTKLEAANQIFLSQTIIPHPQYETMLKNYYLSNIEKVDFSRPGYAAQAINRWVNMLTHGLIPTLVEPGSLSANTKLMLANAMYFKGKWKNAFDFDKTSVKCFFVDVNVCLDTYLMESVNFYKFAYIPSLHAHAVELPYEGEKFSLMLLLPTAINGIEQLVRDLTHISLHTIVSSLRTTEILISVPRFQIDFDTDLVNTLNELGVREIFSTNANLSGIVQGATVDLHIANVLHKAKINVTEEGTIATAATGTVVVPLMGTALPKLIFNHPFLFFLRNMESGDILFAGRLSEPEPAKQSPSVFDTGFPASAQSTSKPISVAGPSHSTFNPVEPVATSSIPTNPIGSTDNSKFQSPQIKPNPNNFFYSPRTINDTPVVQGQNLPTPTTGINGNNQVQPNVVQYQPEGMYRVGQYSSHSSSSGTYNPVPTQNIVPVVSSNTSNGQFKSLSNESPPAVGNNNANPNYNDRYLFS